VRYFNEVLRFVLELLALAAFGILGWSVGTGVWRFLLAAGLPLAAAVFWGAYAAPRSVRRLPDPQRFVFELVFFGAAAAALIYVGWLVPGLVFAVVVLANMVLVRVLKGPSLEPRNQQQ
jgi:hypothetical protein